MATPQELWEAYRAYHGYQSVVDFQRAAGFAILTGQLDPPTVQALESPRCGVSDALRATEDARWRKTRLNYFVESYVGQLDRGTQDDLFKAAWQSWADAADVRFTQVGSQAQADLIISTGRGARPGFDGPGKVLAWAQLPNGTDSPLLMRFDLDESWTIQLLRCVAAHEFGHLLGLDHSQQRTALMYPYANQQIWTPQPRDDVPRIQSYYGPPQTEVDPPPTDSGPLAAWIVRLYVDLLGRRPTAAEVSQWAAMGRDRLAVAKKILGSTERHRRVTAEWYRTHLRREPDAGGLTNFVRALDGGMHPDTALAVMLASAEYYGQTGQSVNLDPGGSGGNAMNWLGQILLFLLQQWLGGGTGGGGGLGGFDWLKKLLEELAKRFRGRNPGSITLGELTVAVAEIGEMPEFAQAVQRLTQL